MKNNMSIESKEILREIRRRIEDKQADGLIISEEIINEILKEVEQLYEETH